MKLQNIFREGNQKIRTSKERGESSINIFLV